MPQPRSSGRRHKRRQRVQTSHGPKRENLTELAPVDDPPAIETFEEWDLGEEVQRAIRNMDIVKPTPIQCLTIGSVLEGRDVIAKAETGTGKTLAFGAPLLARMDPARSSVLGLVLCPTRELAQQVASVLEALALPRGIRVALVVGGDPMHPQIAALQAGAQVVVGTPGRVLDLFQQRFLQFPWTECVVLDEADKMFEIGFLDDVRKILSYLPDERQTLLFSATFPTEVLKLARAETKDPVEVATQKGTVTADSIDQRWVPVDDEDRPLVLTRLFEQSKPDDVFLVFCDRRTEVDRLLRRLERLPFEIKALHGGYDQASRFRVMSAFREGTVKALLATDVASRGLDVMLVTHVVNYSVPRDLEDYAHRIGRTGRAGRSGISITLVPTSQVRKWRALQEQAKWEIREEEAPRATRSRPSRPARPADQPRAERDEERPERSERRPRPAPAGRDERPADQARASERGTSERGTSERGTSERGTSGRVRERAGERGREREARAPRERTAERTPERASEQRSEPAARPRREAREPEQSGSRGEPERREERPARSPQRSQAPPAESGDAREPARGRRRGRRSSGSEQDPRAADTGAREPLDERPAPEAGGRREAQRSQRGEPAHGGERDDQQRERGSRSARRDSSAPVPSAPAESEPPRSPSEQRRERPRRPEQRESGGGRRAPRRDDPDGGGFGAGI